MSASFYDLLKYAATGIASPDMTYYDRMRASTLMGGGAVKTLTGQPPLSFKADGSPLISLSMLGNGQQTGTPSPQNIIMPDLVGKRTSNLFDDDNAELGKWVNSNGSIVTNATYAAGYDITVGTASEFAIKYYGDKPYSYSMAFYDSNGDFLSRTHRSSPSTSYDAFSVPKNAVSARFQVAVDTSTVMTSTILKAMKLMLNLGSTALPYEPYGYKIPITCGGQTVTVYLGQTPTVRRVKKLVLDGTENWGEFGTGTGHFYYIPLSSNGITEVYPVCTHYVSVRIVSGGIQLRIYEAYNSITDFTDFLQQQYAVGNPVTVWYVLATEQTGIVNEPLCKIGTYADELSSTDAGVAIPTVKGANTLTVESELQPSEMTITYRG